MSLFFRSRPDRRWPRPSRRLELEHLEERTLLSSLIPLNADSWTAIGPAPIQARLNVLYGQSLDGGGYGYPAGRVEVAAPDPVDPDVMYIGADNGGVWKTSNWRDPVAPVWTPMTDNQSSLQFANGFKNLAVAPSSTNVVYAAVQGPNGGILKSEDKGQTWSMVNKKIDFSNAQFRSLAIDPTDPNIVFVAIWSVTTDGLGGGVYKSKDGGVSWTNTTSALHSGAASDVVIDPSNPATLYAGLVPPDPFNAGPNTSRATSGVYRSLDGGDSWKLLDGGIITGELVGAAIRVAIAPSAPNVVYAVVFDHSIGDGGFNSLGGLPHRYRSEDGGDSWKGLRQTEGLPGFEDTAALEERSWHIVLAVDPTDPDNVFTNDAYKLFQSQDGGLDWFEPDPYGDDFTGMTFDADGAAVVYGDRTIFRSTLFFGGIPSNFESRVGNLEITEFYDVALDPFNGDRAFGVSQDQIQGVQFTGGPVWDYAGNGGEEGRFLLDPSAPNRVYNFNPLLPAALVTRSDDNGAHWSTIYSSPLDKENYTLAGAVQKAFAMDPNNPQHLVFGLTDAVATNNGGGAWTTLSPFPISGAFITALAIPVADKHSLYAAAADGHFWVSPDDGASWIEADSGLLGNGVVQDVRVDPTDAKKIFVVTSAVGSPNIFTTTNRGGTWTNISGNIPMNLPIHTIFEDWRYPTPVLYVGTDRSAFRSTDLGIAWSKFGNGLPNTSVWDLQFAPALHTLAAATYGRGVYEILLPGPTVSGNVFDDHNSNGLQDAADESLPGWTVYLDANDNLQIDPGERISTSDLYGNFAFTQVAAGTYSIREVVKPGWTRTTPLNLDVVLGDDSSILGVKFGNHHPEILISQINFDTILILGTKKADALDIRDNLRGSITVSGDGLLPVTFDGIRHVTISSADGDDVVHYLVARDNRLPPGELPPVYQPADLQVDLGTGSDVFDFNAAAGFSNPPAGVRSLTVIGGTGDDDVRLRFGGLVEANVAINVDLGAGQDAFLLDARAGWQAPPEGGNSSLRVLGGNGDDTIVIRLDHINAAFSLLADGGEGKDAILVELTLEPRSMHRIDAKVLGGGGDDDLTLDVYGADNLDWLSATIDGGRGLDKARHTANVRVINCER